MPSSRLVLPLPLELLCEEAKHCLLARLEYLTRHANAETSCTADSTHSWWWELQLFVPFVTEIVQTRQLTELDWQCSETVLLYIEKLYIQHELNIKPY